MAGRVLITGAAGYLGRAVVSRFAASGAPLLLLDRSAEKLRDVVPPGADAVVKGGVDLLDPAAVSAALDGHRVETLVHTVGGFAPSSFLKPGPDPLESLFRLNVLSARTAIAAVLPGMMERGQGAIVVVVGEAALHGGAGLGAYAASKAAVLRLVESLAAEARPHGVRANAVLPGTMDTPPNREGLAPPALAKLVPTADVAEVIVFLCSPAARSVSGAAVPILGH